MVFDINESIAAQARREIAVIDQALQGTLAGVEIAFLKCILARHFFQEDRLVTVVERIRLVEMTQEDKGVLQALRDTAHQHVIHAEEMVRRAQARGVKY